MAEDIPGIVHHLSIGANDFERAAAFYDKVMETIGARRIMEFPGAVAYGKQFPEVWIQRPLNGESTGPSNGVHFAFIAPSKEAVQAFYDAALAAGGAGDGAPGPRPEYGEGYYGCFVRDLDGHKIEAAIIPEDTDTHG